MATHSPIRASWPVLTGLELFSRGKVRDTYSLTDGRLLQVATDGISIFDFVLNALVPMKGVILNAMNHSWLRYLGNFGIKTHFIAAGTEIDQYLPQSLRDRIDLLQSRAMVVRKLDMVPVEFVARAVLTGSSVKSYQETGQVCGHVLPSGLEDGDELPYILDTPTTKAQEGHDENLSAQEVRDRYPRMTYLLLQAFQIASRYAEGRGIKLADTKIEGSSEEIGDEVFTPDSSRFWDLRAWKESRRPASGRKAPPPFDKQLVRQWGIEQGVNKLDPANPEDVAKVYSLVVPENLIKQTTQTYKYIFWRLTGLTVEQYLSNNLGVEVKKEPKFVVVVCGSDSDLPAVKEALHDFRSDKVKIEVHVMSYHRNPEAVTAFATNGFHNADAIVGVGSKALALPGVIDAIAYSKGNKAPVIGVALGEPGSKSLLAAQLSIEELPGEPVIIDELTGSAYSGPGGLMRAINRIVSGELPPTKPRKEKPVHLNAWRNF